MFCSRVFFSEKQCPPSFPFLLQLPLSPFTMAIVAYALSQELLAIFDANEVPETLRTFLLKHKVLTPKDFACTSPNEDSIDKRLIEASGVDLDFGQRIRVISAWHAARATMAAPAASPAARAATPVDTMPEGAEARLRGLWKAKHGFFLNGGWLVNAGLMSNIYKGLVTDSTKSLFVPDIKNVKRLSDLSQPSARPLVFEQNAIVSMPIDVDSCTTHPDFYLIFRAYIATVCFVTISEPEWFPYESMILLTDMVFDFVNCRPDGRKPSLSCLGSVFLSMFGDYATSLQNDGISLDTYFKDRSSWTHMWKESITSFDGDRKRDNSGDSSSRAIPALPSDLSSMVHTNNNMLKSLQSSIDKRFKNMTGGGSAAPAPSSGAGDSNGGGAPARVVLKKRSGKHKRGGPGGRGGGGGGGNGGGGGRGNGGGRNGR